MNGLTYLCIEISDECPLTAVHPECPRNADRFTGVPKGEPITIDDAVRFYRYCVTEGFQGMLAPQFYSEPLATRDRLMELMRRLPEARFSLRTNGALLEDDADCRWIIERCEETWVTVYPQTNMAAVKAMGRVHSRIYATPYRFDNRIAEDLTPAYNPRQKACIRPRFEFDIDYYGNGHVCCGDWRGALEFGNIKADDYGDIIRSWRATAGSLAALLNPLTAEGYELLPPICKLCLARTPELGGRLV